MKINRIEEIYSIPDNKMVEYNDIMFEIEKRKNDIYGNPLYSIKIFDLEGNNITVKYRSKLHRTYTSKGYGLFQSYNLSSNLKYILD